MIPVWLGHLERGGKSRRKPVFSFLGNGMPTAAGRVPMRTRVYIDGYNFYYGCLKGTRFKWLDLLPLFEREVLPSVLVEQGGKTTESQLLPLAIKYFTASILEKAAKAQDSVSSQARYHSALRKQHPGRVEIIEGYYSIIEAKAKIVDAQNPRRWPRECQEILVWKLEEKQSDVNLALQLYHDSLTGQIDHAVVVTNDTDIAPALNMIRDHCAVTIGLVVPTRDGLRIPNAELAKQAHWVRKSITEDELARSQLPRVLKGRNSTIKPIYWYANSAHLEEVIRVATPAIGGQGDIFKWLERPNLAFDGMTPLELIESGRADRVIQHLQGDVPHSPGKPSS